MLRLPTRLLAVPSSLYRTIPYPRGNTLPRLVGGFGLGALIAAAVVSGPTAGDLAAQSSPPQIIQVTGTSGTMPPYLPNQPPAISADGSLVAFVLGSRASYGLYVARVDGTDLRLISSNLSLRPPG
jgi:hypothetical protein